jgi:hypothetical protein
MFTQVHKREGVPDVVYQGSQGRWNCRCICCHCAVDTHTMLCHIQKVMFSAKSNLVNAVLLECIDCGYRPEMPDGQCYDSFGSTKEAAPSVMHFKAIVMHFLWVPGCAADRAVLLISST